MNIMPITPSNNKSNNKKAPSFRATIICADGAYNKILKELSYIHDSYAARNSAEIVAEKFGVEPFNPVKMFRDFRKNFENQTKELLPSYKFVLTPSDDIALNVSLQLPDGKMLKPSGTRLIVDIAGMIPRSEKEKTWSFMANDILLSGIDLIAKNGKNWDEGNPCWVLYKKLNDSF